MIKSTSFRKDQKHHIVSFWIDDIMSESSNWLIEALEESLADGVQYKPGQTLSVGWSLLKFVTTNDGLELWEPDFKTFPLQWQKGVNQTIRTLVLQNAICEALGCAPDYSSVLEPVTIDVNILAGGTYEMERPQKKNIDSKWLISKGGSGQDFELKSIYEVCLHHKELIPFFALPTGAFIKISGLSVSLTYDKRTISTNSDPLLKQIVRGF